jgi:hypothetical protein
LRAIRRLNNNHGVQCRLHSMIARNKQPFCIALIRTLRHPRRNRRNSVRVLVSYRALLRARAFRPTTDSWFLSGGRTPIWVPDWYLALIEQKPGALDQAAPLRNWKLPEGFRQLLEAHLATAAASVISLMTTMSNRSSTSSCALASSVRRNATSVAFPRSAGNRATACALATARQLRALISYFSLSS